MDSAKHPYASEIEPGREIDLELVQVPVSEDGKIKSRKFIVAMTLILISSVYTGLGMMDVDTWMMFTGAVGAAYLGVNIYQKNTR
mgnify:FL=1